MKIGILTFHRPINYGAYLQAYALSSKLTEEISDASIEIIDYIAPKENRKIFINILRSFKHFGLKVALKEITKIQIFKKSLLLLPLSSKKMCTENLKKLFDYIDSTYDVLIIGSDAVFNWSQNGYPTAYIPLYSFSIPVLTYAASVHGLYFYDEDDYKIIQCGEAFRKMNFISARDKCTERFVNYCASNLEPIHCCDPTFLIDFLKLTSKEHRSKKQLFEKYHISNEKPYLVLMLQNMVISKKIYDKFKDNFTIISLSMANRYADCYMHDLNPFEWCEILGQAKLVYTSYFHGALLTLQQGVPAMVIDVSHYQDRYEGKLYDLMINRLHLNNMYIQEENWGIKENEEHFFAAADEALNGYFDNLIDKAVKEERSYFIPFLDHLKMHL